MTSPDPRRVVAAHLLARRHLKTAGEVIFKKDRSGDASSWAYADVAPSKREIPRDFNYSPTNQKPLAKVLRATLAALGHALAAYDEFATLRSARLSPDGSLGGRGYIQKIQDMRKQYMNCVEALSALSDTLYDEINAPHWALLSRQEGDEERAEIQALIEDSDEIREDPQEWAERDMDEEFGDPAAKALEEEWEKDDFGEAEASTGDESKSKPEIEDWMNPDILAKGKTASHRMRKPSMARVATAWMDKGRH